MHQFVQWLVFLLSAAESIYQASAVAISFICKAITVRKNPPVSLTGEETNAGKNPMDIRDVSGVQTEKIPGSRIEYNPFPGGFRIIPGRTLHIEFRTDSGSGLIFLVGNMDAADMASAYISHGHLTFARRCGNGRAIEIHRERVDDRAWHTLVYHHNDKGGRLFVDGHVPFRQYHLGTCSNFTSVFFGGISPPLVTGQIPHHMVGTYSEQSDEPRETEMMLRHRFTGCLRNMRIDGKVPTIQPRYYAVSQCDDL